MAMVNTLRGRAGSWLLTQLLATSLCWPILSATAQEGQLESTTDDEVPAGERIVHSAAAFKKDPLAKGVSADQLGPERIDPAIPPQLQPDDSGCQLPPLTLEVLEPASQRAVVRVFGKPPQVVKPGAALHVIADAEKAAEKRVEVRLVREDLLVAEGPADGDGKRPVLWIHPPEAPGAKSRVQCFLPGIVSQ